jgi:hypothetical protein
MLAAISPDLAYALDQSIQSGLLTGVSFMAVDPDSGATAVVLTGTALPRLPVGILLTGVMGQLGELSGYQVIDSERRQVSGVASALTEFTFAAETGQYPMQQHGWQLFVPADQATYLLILASDESQFDDVQPIFNQILEGFQLPTD